MKTEPHEILWAEDANVESEHLGKLRRNQIEINLIYLGEGYDGEFNDTDPEDRRLIRFDVYAITDSLELMTPTSTEEIPTWWSEVSSYQDDDGKTWYIWDPSDASYCSASVDISITKAQKIKMMEMIFNRIEDQIFKLNYKRTLEELSWLNNENLN